MQLFEDIRRDARREDLSIRALAVRHGVHRRTVRAALDSPVPAKRKTPVRIAAKLERFKSVIDEMLVADLIAPRKQKHTVRRIWTRLIDEHGCGASYSSVRDYVARRRPQIAAEVGSRTETAFVLQDHPPGVEPEKAAVVLLHPGSSSGRIWQDVVPLLSEHLGVHAPTLLGHRGGPAARRRPATLIDVIDSAERYLDEQGLDRPHLAGNSLGGAVAIELARRGRAATVCAISPAGFWSASDGAETRLFNRLRMGAKIIRLIYPVAPLTSSGCSYMGRPAVSREAASRARPYGRERSSPPRR